jgi:hypothetical protein
MTKIVDPDQLNAGVEVIFDAGAKTIQLDPTGNLDDDAPGKSSGVAHQAVYSFTKEEYLTTAALRKVRFPFKAIFEAKFEWINSWQPADAQTNDLIRDAGFRVVVLDDEYACIISLGAMHNPAVDQAYYQNVVGFDQSTTNFDKTGELNENILIYDGAVDTRDFLKAYLRELYKFFSEGNLLVDQDLSALTYQAYRLPLANGQALDPNYTVADATIDGSSPYTEFQINFLKGNTFDTWAHDDVYPPGAVVLDAILQSGGSSNGTWWFTPGGGQADGTGTADDVGVTDWESYVGERQIGDEWFAFNRIIDASSGDGDIAEFYNWAQRTLRKTGDINDDTLGTPNQDAYGTVNGNVARPLLSSTGSVLTTQPGVFIDDLDPNFTNAIEYFDITVDGGGLDVEDVPLTSTKRTNPFVSAFTIVFSDEIVAETDGDTYFTAFFVYTTRNTDTDYATTAPTTDHYTLTSGTLDLTTRFTDTDYVAISGFAEPQNNGMFQVSNVVAGSMDCTRVDGQDVDIAEGTGPTVNLDENPYDSPDAIIVEDNAVADIAGEVVNQETAKTFDYDGNVQGGRSFGTDAVIAIEVSGKVSTWVDGIFTITRATGLSYPLNPAEDAVYLNP